VMLHRGELSWGTHSSFIINKNFKCKKCHPRVTAFENHTGVNALGNPCSSRSVLTKEKGQI